MTRRQHYYSCDCGNTDQYYADSDETIKCDECGGKMWVNYSYCKIWIDSTEGFYSRQLGGYIGSASDRRRLMKEKGFIEGGSHEEFLKHNDRVKRENGVKLKKKYLGKVEKAVGILKTNKEAKRKISAEIKNTGMSATTKKISEVLT